MGRILTVTCYCNFSLFTIAVYLQVLFPSLGLLALLLSLALSFLTTAMLVPMVPCLVLEFPLQASNRYST